MAGVGKLGLILLLLVLCVPVAARLSGPSAYGRRFSLGWLIHVCHHPQHSRGTQRRTPPRPDEPLNALLEDGSKTDLSCAATRSAASAHESFAVPAFLVRLLSATKSGIIPDPAFLCTFLI